MSDFPSFSPPLVRSDSMDTQADHVSVDSDPNSRWVSFVERPARSSFGRRRTYAGPPGTTSTAIATPYSRAGNGHSRNSFHPASSNPAKFYIGTYYPSDEEQAQYSRSSAIPELRLVCGSPDIKCFRGQWEVGDKGDKAGKLHVQFAVYFTEKCRIPQARSILGGRWGSFTGWLQVARSDAVWDYVTKLETRLQPLPAFGDLSNEQGYRSDLDAVYSDIVNGLSVYEVMDKYPRTFVKNHAAIGKLCAMYDKPRPYGDCHVEVYWGVTGSGKSHKAFFENPDAYRKAIPGKWYDGYRGETTVVIEEFNPNEDKEMKLPELLKLLDKYPYQVEIKGTSCQMKANRFIITSNIDPATWYDGHPQQAALWRRITKVIKFALNRDQQASLGVLGQVEYRLDSRPACV
uniref:Replication-associated protein n=1 Tax=Ciconia boyciana CRESS-DNA-virus sp. TaxID=2815024 RepID=A0A8A4XBY7_9VIRU|nr:MAG: putative replication initiation protein [Ciconia boyciana CRESS-DNA-virus sp.]